MQKTRLSESLSNNVVSFYPATLLKKKTPGDCFCTTENNKEPKKTEKIKKWRLLETKQRNIEKENLNTTYHKSSHPFIFQKFRYFFFFCFP